MKTRASIAALLAALAPFAAAAAGELPTGAWKGRIGNAEVMACFGDGEPQYYYLRHRRGIWLAPKGADGFEESTATQQFPGEISGRWRIESRDATKLSGTWSSPSGDRKLPIRLERLPGKACEPAFHEPLRRAVQVQRKAMNFEGHAYRELASEQAIAFELDAALPQAAAINRWAMDWLRDQAVEAYACDLSRGGPPEALGRSLRPVVWNTRFLVLQDLLPDTFCGGAHGNAQLGYTTWSLAQGGIVDTWGWIQGGQKALAAKDDPKGEPVMSPLFKLLAQAHPRNAKDDDCAEFMDLMSPQTPYPVAQGLQFPTLFSHARRDCEDEVTLTWRQLAPFLSPAGKAVAAGAR